ncbi:MAG: GNAT family N-acetyltransferase [Clostridium sp.]|uniref:GNAT family N-acetyltransferase n=1 Tax=Clostridium sp. TaxID=1506 RepID=UPI003F347F9F
MIYKVDNKVNNKIKDRLSNIFKGMHDTCILSALQGYMGTIWVDNVQDPMAAQIIVGDFVFYAGQSDLVEAKELLENLPNNSLVIVEDSKWGDKIENIYKGNIDKFQRYAFKKDVESLDINKIESFISKLPKGYELKKVDFNIANSKSFNELSEDFTAQFNSVEDFINRGTGYCIFHGEKVVSGATSYSIYNNGIEIEIDTHEEHRQKGLATVVAAALILECLKEGKYPSWDAANLNSVKLAKKLGYVLDKPYDTYYVNYK